MKVNNEMIDHLCRLARLEVKEDEREQLRSDLERILGFVDKMKELDVGSVEPLVYLSDRENALRPDMVEIVSSRKEALKNAPDTDGQFFKVPKVIQK